MLQTHNGQVMTCFHPVLIKRIPLNQYYYTHTFTIHRNGTWCNSWDL